jgi:6-carboxyhexanoate--CoA ligase
MDQDHLYSIRMRASLGKQHISGAERIVSADKLYPAAQALISRAWNKRPAPEEIVITIEKIGNLTFRTVTALDVLTVNTHDVTAGRATAARILRSLHITDQAVMNAMNHLSRGPGTSGRNMRGAMIIDSQTGERLEPDHDRGVRATRFDWTDQAYASITRELAAMGLTHFRTQEALALATKVAHAPGIIAELCWSDEPDYTAGYVASRGIGYVRFPMLKSPDDQGGGRVFFVDRNTLDMEAFIHYLQFEPVFIVEGGKFRHPVQPEKYFSENNLIIQQNEIS